jgi:hypothetical protein
VRRAEFGNAGAQEVVCVCALPAVKLCFAREIATSLDFFGSFVHDNFAPEFRGKHEAETSSKRRTSSAASVRHSETRSRKNCWWRAIHLAFLCSKLSISDWSKQLGTINCTEASSRTRNRACFTERRMMVRLAFMPVNHSMA